MHSIQKQLFPLQAQRFASQAAAAEALATLGKKWRYHSGDSYAFTAHTRYSTKGRPTPTTPLKATAWQMDAQVQPDAARLKHAKQLGACYVIGSNMPCDQRSDVEVIVG